MSRASSSRGPVQKLTIIDSRRGGKTLLLAGYKYIKRRENKNSSTWHSVNRRNSIKCSGYVTLDSKNHIILKEGKHSSVFWHAHKCVPNFVDNEVKIAISH